MPFFGVVLFLLYFLKDEDDNVTYGEAFIGFFFTLLNDVLLLLPRNLGFRFRLCGGRIMVDMYDCVF